MLKIVIDARMINNSGIGTYMQNMVPNLIKNYELILLGRGVELKKFLWSKQTQIVDFNIPIYSIGEQLMAPFIIPTCDIFLSPHYNIPILPIRAKKRLVIIHDVYHLAFNKTLSLTQKLYSKLMIYSAVHLSDHIITSSQFSKSEILKYEKVTESKISVIHFGFDFEEYSNLASDFERVKNKYNISGKYFLFVSNIKPHKNLSNLLQALKNVLKKIEVKLVVVGEYKKLITSDKKSFELINKNKLLKDNTIFTGFVDKEELASLYKSALALIFPSFYEGFGIPPLEAMACGCPVISSNAASLPEVCNDAAIYINPNNITEIEEKMIRLISDDHLKNQLIKKGKENLERFSNEKFSNNLNKNF